MTERLATFSRTDHQSSGIVTPELVELYKIWGEGEIGILVTGNIMIDRHHIEAAGNMILENDTKRRIEKMKELTTAAQKNGSVVRSPSPLCAALMLTCSGLLV